MKFTKEQLEKALEVNSQYKNEIISSVLEKGLDGTKSEEFYYGMLASLGLIFMLQDKISKQPIFSGIQHIWLKNLSIILIEILLNKENSNDTEEDYFSSIDSI